MNDVLSALASAGIEAYDASITALDAYHGKKSAPIRFTLALCGLGELARHFENLEYPGLFYADAALRLDCGDEGCSAICFRCAEGQKDWARSAYPQLDLLSRGGLSFFDPWEVYSNLRSGSARPRAEAEAELSLFETAILLSRHDYELDAAPSTTRGAPWSFSPREQRDMLDLILTGARPWAALEFLRETGFVEDCWPELWRLVGVGQAKEFHPEGDAWAHTLETFRHRKRPSLRLSLALLLHDTGKPVAESAEGRRFDRHAELGRSIAERFLRRLGYPDSIVSDVVFLVRYHMMPAALPRLPASRLEGVVDDPRFPLLLDLYKCDELSTFRGPDDYYQACAVYRSMLKTSRNVWRAAESRRMAKLFLEEDGRARH